MWKWIQFLDRHLYLIHPMFYHSMPSNYQAQQTVMMPRITTSKHFWAYAMRRNYSAVTLCIVRRALVVAYLLNESELESSQCQLRIIVIRAHFFPDSLHFAPTSAIHFVHNW